MMKPIPETGPALDAEEEALFAAIDADTHVPASVMNANELQRFQDYAKQTRLKNRVQITLDVDERDLNRLKARALREGMPYQTLLDDILRDAANR